MCASGSGASKDALEYGQKVFKTEINSVTDNPNIFIIVTKLFQENYGCAWR
jgi:histidine ammonia-lyase